MNWVKKLYFRQIAALVILGLLIIGCVPSESMAYMVGSDNAADAPLSRAADMDRIQRVLESKIVSGKLQTAGLSMTEIRSRLDKLSDSDLHQFSNQVNSLFAGGQLEIIIALLVIAILVILILKLTDHKIIVK